MHDVMKCESSKAGTHARHTHEHPRPSHATRTGGLDLGGEFGVGGELEGNHVEHGLPCPLLRRPVPVVVLRLFVWFAVGVVVVVVV